MDSDPKTAQAILDDMNADGLDLDRRMLHGLLREKSVIKQHKNIDSVSTARKLMDYYNQRNDTLEVLSKLYYGKALRQHGDFEEALVPLTFTYDLAVDLRDYRSAGLAACELSFIYYQLFIYEEQLRWAELEKENYQKGGYPLHEAWADLDVIDALIKHSRCEEALEIVNRLDSAKHDDNLSIIARLKLQRPWIAYTQGHHEEAIRMYYEAIKEGIEPNSSIWYIIAKNYIQTGEREKAIAALAEIRPAAKNSLDSLWALDLEARLAAADKDYLRAYEKASEFGAKMMADGDRRIGHPATGMLTDALRNNYRLERELSASQRRGNLWLSAFLILVVGALLFAVRYMVVLVKSRERDQELAMHEVKELKMEIETLSKESEAKENIARERILGVFMKRMKHLNDLCEAWHADPTAGTKNKSVVLRELEKLRSRESIEALEKEINECSGDWMRHFRSVYPDLTDEHYTLVMYIFSGLSMRSSAVLLGKKSMNTLYGVRSRLKDKLTQNDTPEAAELRLLLGLD